MPRTFVSLTCIPSRIDNIPKLLESIQRQSYQVDAVWIHCPIQCLRLGNEPYPIDQLSQMIAPFPNVYLNPSYDYGPITKLFPITRLDLNDDDEIIVIDDDHYYHPELFLILVSDFRRKGSNACICVSGVMYPTELESPYYISRPGQPTQCMEAAFGYILRRSFLDKDFDDWVVEKSSFQEIEQSNWSNAFLSDDYVVSRYLDTKQIGKRVLSQNNLINKHTCFVKSIECDDSNSLCSLGHNLNKYLRTEEELKRKGLV